MLGNCGPHGPSGLNVIELAVYIHGRFDTEEHDAPAAAYMLKEISTYLAISI